MANNIMAMSMATKLLDLERVFMNASVARSTVHQYISDEPLVQQGGRCLSLCYSHRKNFQ